MNKPLFSKYEDNKQVRIESFPVSRTFGVYLSNQCHFIADVGGCKGDKSMSGL